MLAAERPRKPKTLGIVWDKTHFDRFYGHPDTGAGYSRQMYEAMGVGQNWMHRLADKRVRGLQGMLVSNRILVVGCGLGFLLEGLKDFGFQQVWGIDSGPYLPTLWSTQAREDVRPLMAQHDIRNVTNQQMRSLTGINNFRAQIVITESVMEGYPPQEQAAIYNACDNWVAPGGAGRVVHLVFPNADLTRYPENAVNVETGEFQSWAGQPIANPGCPPRTIEEWQASRPGHTFVSMENV